jgi:hypothetical protein
MAGSSETEVTAGEHADAGGEVAHDLAHLLPVGPVRASEWARRLLKRLAVGDQLGDGDHLQPVPAGISEQAPHPCRAAVLVEDLADHPGGRQPGEAGEVDGRLGVPGALEHSIGTGAQREDVTGLHEVLGAARQIDGRLNRVRAVIGGDAGADALA